MPKNNQNKKFIIMAINFCIKYIIKDIIPNKSKEMTEDKLLGLVNLKAVIC